MNQTPRSGVRRRFNARAFASAMMAIAGLALPVTGFLNHALQFDAMTTERHAWMAAHTSIGILFTASAAWHVSMNWRPLLAELRKVVDGVPRPGREALYALALLLATTALAAGHAFLVP